MTETPFPQGGNSPYYKALADWANGFEKALADLRADMTALRAENEALRDQEPGEPTTFGFDNGE